MSSISARLFARQIFDGRGMAENEILEAVEAMYEKSIWGDSGPYFIEGEELEEDYEYNYESEEIVGCKEVYNDEV